MINKKIQCKFCSLFKKHDSIKFIQENLELFSCKISIHKSIRIPKRIIQNTHKFESNPKYEIVGRKLTTDNAQQAGKGSKSCSKHNFYSYNSLL